MLQHVPSPQSRRPASGISVSRRLIVSRRGFSQRSQITELLQIISNQLARTDDQVADGNNQVMSQVELVRQSLIFIFIAGRRKCFQVKLKSIVNGWQCITTTA